MNSLRLRWARRAGIVLFVCLVLLAQGALAAEQAGGAAKSANIWNGPKAKYVFFFIGDGMGLQQITAAEAYLAAVKGESRPGLVSLSFSRFPQQGLSTTYSADSFITDSAPAGTALATGYKTDNGVIGVDPSKKTSFPTMAEAAKKAGMRVGIISTVSLNHATPASFYAHIPSRNSYYEIGLQLIDSGFDYFAGGGLHKHQDKDRESLYDVAGAKGYKVLRDKASVLAAGRQDLPLIAVNRNLDVDSAMPYAIDSREDDLSLADFTRKGIAQLDNEQGFFMMIEGGKVDWACHANDAATSIHDTVAFDDAVREALAFAAQHPDDTLIVVTGDHETGGMGLGFAGTEYKSYFSKIASQKVSFDKFDKDIAALRASKGEAATLADVAPLITDRFGLLFLNASEIQTLRDHGGKQGSERLGMALSAEETAALEQALRMSMSGKRSKDASTQEFLLYGGYEPLSIQITHILNNKAGIGWTSYAHTGVPVPVFARGPGAALFSGYYDNTDVAWKIYSIMGLAADAPAAFRAASL